MKNGETFVEICRVPMRDACCRARTVVSKHVYAILMTNRIAYTCFETTVFDLLVRESADKFLHLVMPCLKVICWALIFILNYAFRLVFQSPLSWNLITYNWTVDISYNAISVLWLRFKNFNPDVWAIFTLVARLFIQPLDQLLFEQPIQLSEDN